MHIVEREMLERDIRELKRIGSRKDPLQFHAMRAFLGGTRRAMNRSIILNFSDGGRHGCRFSCKFCSWKDREEVARDIVPTREAIREFLRDFEGYRVTISGGGDPLYRFEENRERLYAVIDAVREEGFLVEIVTKEYLTVMRHADELAERVSHWSFSEEGKNPRLLEALGSVESARVSKIVSSSTEFGEMWRYARYYAYSGLARPGRRYGLTQIFFREDYFDRNFHLPGRREEIRAMRKTYGRRVVFLDSDRCSNNLFLVGNEIRIGETPVGRA